MKRVVARSAAPDIEVRTASAEALPFRDRTDVELAALAVVKGVGASQGAVYNPSTNQVDLTIYSDDPAVKSRVEEALSTPQGRDYAGPRLSIDYQAAEHALQLQATFRGGEIYDSKPMACTANFTATRDGQAGIVTAEHCGSITQNGTQPSKYDGLDASGTQAAGSYDLRFMKVAGTATNAFRDSGTSARIVTSIGVMSVGLTIYKYGRITGYGTTTVKASRGCQSTTAGNYCGLYETNQAITQNGDSGGPWFVVYKGYGSTTGQFGGGGGSAVTPIGYVTWISGSVTIKLN